MISSYSYFVEVVDDRKYYFFYLSLKNLLGFCYYLYYDKDETGYDDFVFIK